MVVIVVAGYQRTYITKGIPLDVYANKNNRPYMNIKDWAENKEPDEDA